MRKSLRKSLRKTREFSRIMSLNSEDRSVADVQERSEASIHPPNNLGSCAPTNPQSSVGNAEEYCSIAQSWPNRKTTLGNRLHYLYNNQILSDVTFLVGKRGQQQRIPAHKLVLSVGSAVFHAMFNGALATTSLEIEVPDVEPAAFLAVLLFLYTDQFCGDPETVMMTLYAAKKYAVEQVEEYCVKFLRSNLSSSNALMLLIQARFFNEPELASVCLNEIDKSTAVALSTDAFTDIDLDTLMLLLERQTLRVEESKLFEAVVRWSEAECTRQQLPVIPENQRTVLGEALYLVRFPVISPEKFAAGPAQSGILTDREIVSLYQYFMVNPKPSVDFEVKPRIPMFGKELEAQTYRYTGYYSSTRYSISFMVDKRIFLIGYKVCKHQQRVSIRLIHTSSGKVITSNSENLSVDHNTTTVRFQEPVEIMANTEYIALAEARNATQYDILEELFNEITVACSSITENVKFKFTSTPSVSNGPGLQCVQIKAIIFCV